MTPVNSSRPTTTPSASTTGSTSSTSTTRTMSTTATQSTTSTAGATAIEGAPVDTMPSPTSSATFEAASGTKGRTAPFGPPPSPQLIDERTAMSPADRERIVDENVGRIEAYNDRFQSYLETYKAGVESAPSLDKVLHFGEPVSYQPTANLPVGQRKHYDEHVDEQLGNHVIVNEALGERVLKETGVKMPGTYAFADFKATILGNGVKGRAMLDDEGWHLKGSTQVGLNSKVVDPKLTAFGEKVGFGVTTNIDMETGDAKLAVQARAGGFSMELDEAGKMTTEAGFDVGDNGSVKAGSSYDGKNRRAEMFVKAGVKFEEVELDAKVGLGVQLLTTDYMKKVIDPDAKGFFDDDKIKAWRNSGR